MTRVGTRRPSAALPCSTRGPVHKRAQERRAPRHWQEGKDEEKRKTCDVPHNPTLLECEPGHTWPDVPKPRCARAIAMRPPPSPPLNVPQQLCTETRAREARASHLSAWQGREQRARRRRDLQPSPGRPASPEAAPATGRGPESRWRGVGRLGLAVSVDEHKRRRTQAPEAAPEPWMRLRASIHAHVTLGHPPG